MQGVVGRNPISTGMDESREWDDKLFGIRPMQLQANRISSVPACLALVLELRRRSESESDDQGRSSGGAAIWLVEGIPEALIRIIVEPNISPSATSASLMAILWMISLSGTRTTSALRFLELGLVPLLLTELLVDANKLCPRRLSASWTPSVTVNERECRPLVMFWRCLFWSTRSYGCRTWAQNTASLSRGRLYGKGSRRGTASSPREALPVWGRQ
ncbi:hypothetical protein CRG98_025208 [Punica granatum]|uniref:Uncharacterized protein n=1 Tax=Punica granatum TaxID=22663 RepID=A0A2I0JDU9_PUNGR|nr:hypothetical protein CRG98_025208 [Punica granatum]